MEDTSNRNRPVTFYTTDQVAQALDKAAGQDRRSVSSLVEILVINFLRTEKLL